MLCDADVTQKSVFYKITNSSTKGGSATKEPIVYLSEDTGDYFLNQCLDYIELKHHVVQRLNLEFAISLCDNNGKFIAKDTKKNWKKVLPSLTNADLEYIKLCRLHLVHSKTLDTSEKTKDASLACKRLAERYFTVNMQLSDDMNNFNNFKYMHRILKENLAGGLTENSFYSNSVQSAPHQMGFSKVVFKFKNTYDGKTSPLEKLLSEKKAVKLFRNYYPEANMKAFPVNIYVKPSHINKVWAWISIFIYLIGIGFYN